MWPWTFPQLASDVPHQISPPIKKISPFRVKIDSSESDIWIVSNEASSFTNGTWVKPGAGDMRVWYGGFVHFPLPNAVPRLGAQEMPIGTPTPNENKRAVRGP